MKIKRFRHTVFIIFQDLLLVCRHFSQVLQHAAAAAVLCAIVGAAVHTVTVAVMTFITVATVASETVATTITVTSAVVWAICPSVHFVSIYFLVSDGIYAPIPVHDNFIEMIAVSDLRIVAVVVKPIRWGVM